MFNYLNCLYLRSLPLFCINLIPPKTKKNLIFFIGGSVIKIFVNNIQMIFKELIDRKTVAKNKLHLKTPWNTSEFGFHDLNKNAVFFVEDL